MLLIATNQDMGAIVDALGTEALGLHEIAERSGKSIGDCHFLVTEMTNRAFLIQEGRTWRVNPLNPLMRAL